MYFGEYTNFNTWILAFIISLIRTRTYHISIPALFTRHRSLAGENSRYLHIKRYITAAITNPKISISAVNLPFNNIQNKTKIIYIKHHQYSKLLYNIDVYKDYGYRVKSITSHKCYLYYNKAI